MRRLAASLRQQKDEGTKLDVAIAANLTRPIAAHRETPLCRVEQGTLTYPFGLVIPKIQELTVLNGIAFVKRVFGSHRPDRGRGDIVDGFDPAVECKTDDLVYAEHVRCPKRFVGVQEIHVCRRVDDAIYIARKLVIGRTRQAQCRLCQHRIEEERAFPVRRRRGELDAS